MQKLLFCFLLISSTLFGGEKFLPIELKLDKTFELNNDFIKKLTVKGTLVTYIPIDFSEGELLVDPFDLSGLVTWHDDTEFDIKISLEPVIYYKATDICDLEFTDVKLNVSEVGSNTLPTKWLLQKIKTLTHKFDEGTFLPDKKAELIKAGNEKFNEFRKDICED